MSLRVGLIPIEPRIVNAAYMQISAYHKRRGDTVDWWLPIEDRAFDDIYCSSLFTFTDKRDVPARAICGGTGYDVSSRLGLAYEACEYDYSIYPRCHASLVWFSRGCIRQCSFCCVWWKDGPIHPVTPKPLNPRGEVVWVMDDNFFACEAWPEAIERLVAWGQPVDFQNGIDVRLYRPEHARALKRLRWAKRLRCAWDDPHVDLREDIRRLAADWPQHKLMCYVLIGYDSTAAEDLWRVQELAGMGIDPFVMPYHRNDPYERRFARWVNHKAIFRSVAWEDYR